MQASYDAATGRLSSLAHVAGASDLSRFAYSYNGVGNITGIDESGDIGVRSRQFTYDELQRLTAGGTAAAPESYTYDAVGNRDVTHLSALHVVNDADRLLEDEQFFYNYDANGNLIAKTAKANGDITSYDWDAQDQLIRINNSDGTTVDYAYDAIGRRIEKDVDGAVIRYVYDGEDIYIETDGADALQARYAHGDRTDNPLSFERAGADFFYHADHQGSIRQVTDIAGAVVNSYEYDSYGNFLARVETVAQPYGYTAREQDEESDLYYYRARYYAPNTGRFISEDSLGFDGDDFNVYRYVANDPLNVNDPFGLLGAGAASRIGNFIRNTARAAADAACDVLTDPIVQSGVEGAVSGGVTGAIAGGGPGAVIGAAAGALSGSVKAVRQSNPSGVQSAVISGASAVAFASRGGRLSAGAGAGVGGGLGGPGGSVAGGAIGGAIDGVASARNQPIIPQDGLARDAVRRAAGGAIRGAGAGVVGAGAGAITGGFFDGVDELCDDCTNE